MAKLITHHDPFHIHKILGVLVLVNYLVRLWLILFTGKSLMTLEDVESGKCTKNRFMWDVASVVLTGVLSWSSLLLPLPKVRNFNSPMIWPEFRFHSITFASRHVIGTLVSMFMLWPTNIYFNYLSKLTLVLGTCYTADYITHHYGCKDNRTTNAMPYPSNISDIIQKGIKKNYAQAQFLAAMGAVTSYPDASFWPILGIQSAPLLMTLVRKGKVSSLFYHRVYTLCLTTPMAWYVGGAYMNGYIHVLSSIWAICAVFSIPYEMRVFYGCSKFTTWAVGVALLNFCVRDGALDSFVRYTLFTSPWGVAFCVTSYVWVLWSKMRYFYPLANLKATQAPPALGEVIVDVLNSNLKLNIKKIEDKSLKHH